MSAPWESADHRQVERRMMELIEQMELPAPDEVEYGEREVRLIWSERKVVVVVELDESDEVVELGTSGDG